MSVNRLCAVLLVITLVLALFPQEPSGHYRSRRRRRHRYSRRRVSRRQATEAKKVRQMFDSARTVGPNYFAITLEQAKKFASLTTLSTPRSCLRMKRLPKYADCKIKEFVDIISENTCEVYAKTSFDSLSSGRIITTGSCERKETLINGALPLCTGCAVIRELPKDRFPRYINEVVCSTNDTRCLGGYGYGTGGVCVQQSITLQFRLDSNQVGIDKLGQWIPYPQEVRTACVCRVPPGSALAGLV